MHEITDPILLERIRSAVAEEEEGLHGIWVKGISLDGNAYLDLQVADGSQTARMTVELPVHLSTTGDSADHLRANVLQLWDAIKAVLKERG